MKKAFTLAMATILILSLFAGCGTTSGNKVASAGTSKSKASTDGKVYEIAVPLRIADMYAAWLKTSFETEAEKYDNIKVTVMDNQDDAAKWMELVENSITQHYDYIIAQTPICDAAGTIQKAKDAGIGYITINLAQKATDGICPTILCEEYKLGYLIGERAAKELPENAKVVILNGIAGIPPTTERRRGMQDALLNVRTDVELLDEQVADFDKSTAMDKTDDWLQAFPEIDGVLASSDSMALGAVESFKSNGRDIATTRFYGCDGLTDACQAVMNGEMSASALQDATEFARIALEMVQKDIRGEISLVNDNWDKYIAFDPILIDSVNAEKQFAFYREQGLVK